MDNRNFKLDQTNQTPHRKKILHSINCSFYEKRRAEHMMILLSRVWGIPCFRDESRFNRDEYIELKFAQINNNSNEKTQLTRIFHRGRWRNEETRLKKKGHSEPNTKFETWRKRIEASLETGITSNSSQID